MKTIELPKLIFYTVGLPGSGKTELSVNLQGHTNVEHVSTDKIGINIFGFLRFYKPEERDLVYKEALYQVEGLIWDNKPVVYDANANTVSSREGLRALAKNNQVPLIAIYVKTPLSDSHTSWTHSLN